MAVIGLRGVPDVQGGIETHVQNLYPLLVDDSLRATIYSRRQFVDARGAGEWHGIRVVPLWAPRRTGVEALVHSLLAMLSARLRGTDLLHIHGIGPALVTPLARLLGMRVIVTHHGKDYDREKWGKFAKFLLRSGEAFACRFANKVICVAKSDRDRLCQRFGESSAVRIPNGTSRMVPPGDSRVLQELGLTPGRYLLNVARMVPEKRQLDLIRAFSARPHNGWKLVLVGSAQNESDYPAQVSVAASKDPDCILAGMRHGADLSALYANAGAYVLPSAHEGLPITLLEALSFGLPCIASDIPANREVELPGECYFRVQDPADLSARLDAVMTEPTVGIRFPRQQSSGYLPEEYRWDSVARSTRAVFAEVLGTAGPMSEQNRHGGAKPSDEASAAAVGHPRSGHARHHGVQVEHVEGVRVPSGVGH